MPQPKTKPKTPATIRYNNPGAMALGTSARKFGATRGDKLNDGLGQNNAIAYFADGVHGAAALFDLLNSPAYKGKTLQAAITKWCGGNWVPSYLADIEKNTEMDRTWLLDDKILLNSALAIELGKAMALQETGYDYPMTDDQWMKAWTMVFDAHEPDFSTWTAPAPVAAASATIPVTKSNDDAGAVHVSGSELVRTQHFDPPADAPAYILDAVKDIGTPETIVNQIGNRISNPVVQRWIAKATDDKIKLPDTSGTPWCMYYVNAKLENAGITGTKDGMARSILKWGDVVPLKDSTKWKVGDIGVKWRGNHDDGVYGHVFFIIAWDEHYVYALGGNQDDHVNISAFPRAQLLGVRRPRSVWQSRTIQKAAAGAGVEGINQAVQNLMPDPSTVADVATNHSSIVGHVDKVADALQKAQDPLTQLATYKPWIVGVLSVISIALICWAAYHRFTDHKEGFNT